MFNTYLAFRILAGTSCHIVSTIGCIPRLSHPSFFLPAVVMWGELNPGKICHLQ